jgi:EmrB/QacA subfamily drug resistance transporter
MIEAELDPKRWLTLGIVLLALVIVVVDNTVLTVAIPTIIEELHTTLPAVQWVVTGYSLTFATLLIIGGRLGDVYGPRRMFLIGAGFFGVGSLVASLAHSIPQLLVGEAVIEGIGAAMMMPSTLAILSNTFRGRERAMAFAAWGAVAGGAVAFGPALGGYLTTYHSWRWAFRINVIVAPLAILGALVFMRRDADTGRGERLDLPGAVLVAVGAFSLVFGISQASTYGWWEPLSGVGSVWPTSRPVSITPVLFLIAAVALTAFVRLELHKERTGDSPLFEFGQLRFRSFRYGLITSLTIAMGQLGMLFVLPVFLQDGKQLSAVTNGLWLAPMGIAIFVAAQVGGRLTRVIGTTTIVRCGLILDAAGLLVMGFLLRPGITFLGLLPALLMFGFGVGLASSQLTNVILYDIAPEKSGVASGANSTVRQVGSALGVAIIGSVLTSQIIRHATLAIEHTRLPGPLRGAALRQVRDGSVNLSAATHAPAELRHALESAVAAASRPSLLLAASIVAVGAALSFLIPPVDQRLLHDDEVGRDLLDVAEPVDTHVVH